MGEELSHQYHAKTQKVTRALNTLELKDINWHGDFDSESRIPGSMSLSVGYQNIGTEDYFDSLHVGPEALIEFATEKRALFGYGCLFTSNLEQAEVETITSSLISSIPSSGDWERDVLLVSAFGRWTDDPRADEYHEDEAWPQPAWAGYLSEIPKLEARKIRWGPSGVKFSNKQAIVTVGVVGEGILSHIAVDLYSIEAIRLAVEQVGVLPGYGKAIHDDSATDLDQLIMNEVGRMRVEKNVSLTNAKLSRLGTVL